MELETLLGDQEPRGLSLKKAWRAVIQATRDRKRRTGQEGPLQGMAEVVRFRRLPIRQDTGPGQLGAFKALLAKVAETEGEERDQALGSLEAMIPDLVHSVQSNPLDVELRGWPAMLGDSDRARLLGHRKLNSIGVDDALDLIHRLHDQVIGGSRLELIPDLPPETVLPALPRSRRNRSPRGGGRPWIEITDEESRFSLTPESIALAQAELFISTEIIDAFGGVGGNTLALARKGKRVWMIEANSARLEAAGRSLVTHRLRDRVTLIHGRAEDELPGLLRAYPRAGVFLDPPWGGRDWSRQGVDWQALFGELDSGQSSELVLKLPRSFDLASLPPREGGWRARLEWGEPGALPKMLTAWSPQSAE